MTGNTSEQADTNLQKFQADSVIMAVNSLGTIFVWYTAPDLVLEYHPGDTNYEPLLDWCKKRRHRFAANAAVQQEEAADVADFSLTDHIKRLDRMVSTLWGEVFSARQAPLGDLGPGRTTLKGKVNDLCYREGIPPVGSP